MRAAPKGHVAGVQFSSWMNSFVAIRLPGLTAPDENARSHFATTGHH
jgi:hypothetical protein